MVNRRVLLETGVVTLAIAGVTAHMSPLPAQESTPRESASTNGTTPEAEAAPEAVEAVAVEPPEIEVLPSAAGETRHLVEGHERSNRILSAAFLLLMGIVTLGVLLLATVLLLGSRARRVAREPLPESPPQDPDWFLRKKLEPPAGSHTPSQE